MKVFFFLLLSLVSLFACSNSSNPPAKQVPLPSIPVEVAKEWVEAFYKDDFSKAATLSTAITLMMIDSVKKEMQANVPFIPFTISEMACEIRGDSALCTYIYQEEEDRFKEQVNLVNIDGRWLVNESWNNSSELEQELDMIQEELEKLLEEDAVFDKE